MEASVAQRGSAALLVAAGLLVLIGMTAISLDGGSLRLVRADAQGAADHGALAAAWASCHGESAVDAGRAAAADNGYVHDGVTVVVDVASQGAHTYNVTIRAMTDVSIAQVIGPATLPVRASAVASCASGAEGDYAIFAGSDTCPEDKPAIDWSGSNTSIQGRVHSNSAIRVGGSGNSVMGQGSYVTDYSAPGDVTWDPSANNPEQLAGPLAWPVDFDMADYRPGGAAANAAAATGQYYDYGDEKIDLSAAVAPGIYYTTNDIVLSASDIDVAVTLVTDAAPESGKGVIDISGSNQKLSPFADSLLAFSTFQKNADLSHIDNCDSPAVKLSGSDTSWTGTIYAPGGQVQLSGSSNTSTLQGRLIGWTIQLNGSSLVTAPDDSLVVGTATLALLE